MVTQDITSRSPAFDDSCYGLAEGLPETMVWFKMTTTSIAPVHHSARRAVRPERLKDYLLFTICASLYILPFMRLYMFGTDEGTLDYGAVRIVHGQVFARDFFEVIGPGTFYWLAAFFKVLGVSFFSSRVCLFITSLGTALLMYFLSRRLCLRHKTLPSILLAGIYFGGFWPAISHHVDSNFFALLTVACMVVWQDSRSNNWLVGAGVAVGLTTAFLQPKGMLLFCGLLVWLWMLYRRRLVSLAPMGVLAGTYCSVIAIILLYFWSKGALRDLIYANVLWPSQHYGTVNSVRYAQGILSSPGSFDGGEEQFQVDLSAGCDSVRAFRLLSRAACNSCRRGSEAQMGTQQADNSALCASCWGFVGFRAA